VLAVLGSSYGGGAACGGEAASCPESENYAIDQRARPDPRRIMAVTFTVQ